MKRYVSKFKEDNKKWEYKKIGILKESLLDKSIIEYNNPSNGGYRANITAATLLYKGKKIMVTVYSGVNDESYYGSEYYSGSNYIIDSSDRSHSRNFKFFNQLPSQLLPIVSELILLHNKKYDTNISL